MKNNKQLQKIFSVIVIALCIINLTPQIGAKAEVMSSSRKTEVELKEIIESLGEANIIFEDGINLYIGESVDLFSKLVGINVTEIISNNEDVLSVQDNLLVGVSEGVTFLIIKIDDKYHVSQVYVENGIEAMSINDYVKDSSRNHYVVFVDAGHGGSDPGAVANGINEKDINLAIALKVRNKLKNLGVEVVMNRETDVFVDYHDTAVMANNSKSDVFVSIHNNSAAASAYGIEAYYNKDIDKSYAGEIYKRLISYTGMDSKGQRGLKWNNFTVTVRTTMPAVLTECGFITNANEAAKLKTDSYQESLSNAIVDGIMEYLVNNVEINTITNERIFGQTRYETSYNVFEKGWDKAETAILVTGMDYPDALSAAPLAGKYGAPILSVRNTSLQNQPELKSLLINKGVKNVYIIGGQGVLPAVLENELNEMGIANKRLGGINRYETSVKIAEELGSTTGEIAIAYGYDFADGLSISSVAAFKGMPILLTETNNIPEVIKNYISQNGINKTYIIGSEGVVSQNVANQLPNVERLGGKNRYQTNVSVFNKFKDEINLSDIYVASALDFPDALSSSALAAKTNSFVILSNTKIAESSIKELISRNVNSINKAYTLGSNKVISDSVLLELGIR